MSRAIAEEALRLGGLTVHVQPEWRVSYPQLVQGVTGRGVDFGRGSDGSWDTLASATGFSSIARCAQVHGSVVVSCDDLSGSGVQTLGEGDALVTARPDVLMAIGVADCVPVFLLDPAARVSGLAHAGWRGIAAGVVERALDCMLGLGAELERIRAHLGPAICGRCYEVGPEVPAALGLEEGIRYVNLRACVEARAVARGLPPAAVTISQSCTRCDGDLFYSYRAGDSAGRMCAILGGAALGPDGGARS